MLSLNELFAAFLDTLSGHLALVACLLAVTDERKVWERLKKLPLLLLSPAIAVLVSAGLQAVPELGICRYFIISFTILLMCTLWVRWVWRFGFWRAFAVTCMAGVFQVAAATLSFWALDENTRFAAAVGLHLAVSIAAALLLYRLRFGLWFRLLLESQSAPRRAALLLFALEISMELFLSLPNGIRPRYLPLYYLLAAVIVGLAAALVIYLARWSDTARKVRAQQDVIARQRLYEQDLENIRAEVRSFRHDCRNLLAGLSWQAGQGEDLRRTLVELEDGFDRRLGTKIQASAQLGNLQLPEARSLLLSKLAAMREKGVQCRLEVLYPVTAVDMDVWDFVRCLGVLTDNAMEAALDTEHPWVEIVLLAQAGRMSLRVSNPYANAVEPEKMWCEGWSTKGAGRGLGLCGYQRILQDYPNASTFTSWEGGVFVQELTVEDRR